MDDELFVAAIRDFLAQTGIKPTTFSREATGDPNFWRLIELTGRKTRDDRKRRVLSYMARERRKAGKRAA